MNSWFDYYEEELIYSKDINKICKEHSQDELMQSAEIMLKIIDEEILKLPD